MANATHNGLCFILEPNDYLNQQEAARLAIQRHQDVTDRLTYIGVALTHPSRVRHPLITDETKEKLSDPQAYHYKVLMRAVENGLNANDAFLTLPHSLDQLSESVVSFRAHDTKPYQDSGLLIPRLAGRLAVMVTGNHGEFEESEESSGLYITDMLWAQRVKKYPKLLQAIRSDAPYGITNFGPMTAGHVVARDLQLPGNTKYTNGAMEGTMRQDHVELNEIRPRTWTPKSFLSPGYGTAAANTGFEGYRFKNYPSPHIGVRVTGELEET